jgi:hypothetical protein
MKTLTEKAISVIRTFNLIFIYGGMGEHRNIESIAVPAIARQKAR